MKTPKSSPTRQESYRQILLAKKAELSADAGFGIGDRFPWTDWDPLTGLGVGRLEDMQLVAVEAALRRIDCGAYGRCMDCGQAISDRRLAAIPWVTRCIACQELSGSAGEPADRFGDDRRDHGSLS